MFGALPALALRKLTQELSLDIVAMFLGLEELADALGPCRVKCVPDWHAPAREVWTCLQ